MSPGEIDKLIMDLRVLDKLIMDLRVHGSRGVRLKLPKGSNVYTKQTTSDFVDTVVDWYFSDADFGTGRASEEEIRRGNGYIRVHIDIEAGIWMEVREIDIVQLPEDGS